MTKPEQAQEKERAERIAVPMSKKPIILITGASRGLGAAAATILARQGCRLALNGRDREALQEVARKVIELGGEALEVPGDVGDIQACQNIVQATLEHFGGLDVLVNNAAVIEPIGHYTGIDVVLWKRAMDVNLLGPLVLARFAAAALIESKGRIINVSTGAATHPLPAWSAYCASKAGLHHLTRTMAAEENRITALSLRPGVMDTAMQDQIRRDGPGHMPAELSHYFQQLKDTRQLEPPEVPGRAVAWLALHAPPEWSGEMLDYTDPRIVAGAKQAFDE